MKQIVIGGVVAAAVLAVQAAHAQSSVTVGGIADSAARSVSNQGAGSVRSLVSGSNSTSRLIVRGVEDLGSGLSASFHLEHGILLDLGNPSGGNQFWDRRATVSLSSRSLGEVRLGRDFVPSYVSWTRYDPFSYVGAAGSNNFVSATPLGPIRSTFGSSTNTTVRSSNAVQLLLPSGLGGLEGGLLFAPGEGGLASAGQHKVQGLRLGWVQGRVNLSAARTTAENDLTASGRFSDTTAGGSYDLGVVKLNAAWRQFKQFNAKQTNLMLSGIAPVGSGELKFSFIRANLAGRVGSTAIDANDATQLGLGYVHNLSRRSALYTTYSRISNKGAATYVVPGGPAVAGGGRTSTGYEAGIRHSF